MGRHSEVLCWTVDWTVLNSGSALPTQMVLFYSICESEHCSIVLRVNKWSPNMVWHQITTVKVGVNWGSIKGRKHTFALYALQLNKTSYQYISMYSVTQCQNIWHSPPRWHQNLLNFKMCLSSVYVLLSCISALLCHILT